MECMRTFCGEQSLLCGGIIIDAIESEGELLGLVLGIRDLDGIIGSPVIFAAALVADGVNDDILVELLFQQWSYTCYHSYRHIACRMKNPNEKPNGTHRPPHMNRAEEEKKRRKKEEKKKKKRKKEQLVI